MMRAIEFAGVDYLPRRTAASHHGLTAAMDLPQAPLKIRPMPIFKSNAARLFAIAVLSMTLCGPANAYIDPNAGGMLFQLLAPVFAAAVGAWLFLRRWIADLARRMWHRMTSRKEE